MEHLYEPTHALQELARVSRRYLVLSVPHEPWFCFSNAARGKNLDIRPRGSDPDHRQFWTRAAFGRFVEQVADVRVAGWLASLDDLRRPRTQVSDATSEFRSRAMTLARLLSILSSA